MVRRFLFGALAICLLGGGARKSEEHALTAHSGPSQEPSGQPQTSREKKKAEASIVYRNTQYGFCFSLPISWRGYSIVADQWRGNPLNEQGEQHAQKGPMISVRHPLWTSANPRQDIPIMVFTQAQWGSLQRDEFHIGAAPIGPSELGRNHKYVFALPARYDYAFPTGYEEVEQILATHPLNGGCKAR